MNKHWLFNLQTARESINGRLPQISFPPQIHFEDKNTELSGYFVNYDGTINDLFNEIKNKGFKNVINSNSEFLLFLFDKNRGILEIASDQIGKFPFYFYQGKGDFVFSSSFALLKNEVKNVGLSINLDILFTALFWEWHNTERTLINEIKRIPAGCVLRIPVDEPHKFSIVSYVDVNLNIPPENNLHTYESIGVFARDWVNGMATATDNRLRKVVDLKIGCDLSSGFDCTLIAYCLSKLIGSEKFNCYAQFSDLAKNETDIELMNNFAKKNNLKIKTFDASKFYSYEHDLIDVWSRDDPYQVSSTYFEDFISKLEQDGVKIQFTGDGGDEIYGASEEGPLLKFPIQNSFISNVIYLKKYGLEKIFTEKATEFAFSTERFNTRGQYPLTVSTSVASIFWNLSEILWTHDVWFMTPFIDTRLVKLIKQAPEIKGDKGVKKTEIMKHLTDIFPAEMFKVKAGLEDVYINFIINQKLLIYSVLQNSFFDKIGWINKEFIIKLLENENSILYKDEFAITFQTMIALDWFIQKNKLTVTNR